MTARWIGKGVGGRGLVRLRRRAQTTCIRRAKNCISEGHFKKIFPRGADRRPSAKEKLGGSAPKKRNRFFRDFLLFFCFVYLNGASTVRVHEAFYFFFAS